MAADRAEFAELSAAVDPFEHGCDKGALDVGARRELAGVEQRLEPTPTPAPQPGATPVSPTPEPAASMRTLRLAGTVPPEVWNRLGTKILPKLRSGSELKIGVEFTVTVPANAANGLASELRQILQELGLGNSVKVE